MEHNKRDDNNADAVVSASKPLYVSAATAGAGVAESAISLHYRPTEKEMSDQATFQYKDTTDVLSAYGGLFEKDDDGARTAYVLRNILKKYVGAELQQHNIKLNNLTIRNLKIESFDKWSHKLQTYISQAIDKYISIKTDASGNQYDFESVEYAQQAGWANTVRWLAIAALPTLQFGSVEQVGGFGLFTHTSSSTIAEQRLQVLDGGALMTPELSIFAQIRNWSTHQLVKWLRNPIRTSVLMFKNLANTTGGRLAFFRVLSVAIAGSLAYTPSLTTSVLLLSSVLYRVFTSNMSFGSDVTLYGLSAFFLKPDNWPVVYNAIRAAVTVVVATSGMSNFLGIDFLHESQMGMMTFTVDADASGSGANRKKLSIDVSLPLYSAANSFVINKDSFSLTRQAPATPLEDAAPTAYQTYDFAWSLVKPIKAACIGEDVDKYSLDRLF